MSKFTPEAMLQIGSQKVNSEDILREKKPNRKPEDKEVEIRFNLVASSNIGANAGPMPSRDK